MCVSQDAKCFCLFQCENVYSVKQLRVCVCVCVCVCVSVCLCVCVSKSVSWSSPAACGEDEKDLIPLPR